MADLSDAQKAFLEKFVMKPDAAVVGPPPADKGTAALLKQAKALQARLSGLPAPAQGLLAAARAPIDRAVAEAEKAGGDTEAAARALDPVADDIRRVSADIPLMRTYVIEAARFQTRLQQSKARLGGKGGIAIATYIERLAEDDRRRAAAEARGDIRMALVAVEARDHLHDTMMQDADRGAEYQAHVAALEAEIKRLEVMTHGGVDAKPVIADVRGMMVDAANFTKSGNWVGAVMMLRKARTALSLGTKGLDLTQTLGRAGEAAGFETAQRAHVALFKGISRSKGASTFGAQLRSARAQAAAAAKALPDVTRARELLDEATGTCQALVQPLMQQARFRATLKSVLAQHKAMRALDIDGCIAAERKSAAGHLKTANARAKAHDFEGGLAALDEASEAIRQGHVAGTAYAGLVRESRLDLAQALKRAGPDKDTNPLRALFERISAAYEKRDLGPMAKLADEARSLAAAI